MAQHLHRGFELASANSSRNRTSHHAVPGGFSKLAKDAMSREHNSHYDSSRRPRDSVETITEGCRGMSIYDSKVTSRKSMVGSVQTYTDKGRTDTKARDYCLGDIVRVPHVAPSLDPQSMMGDCHVGYIDNTGPVVGKLRPSIIIGIHEHHMICLPMVTSGGRGPSPADSNNCILVRHWNDDSRTWSKHHEYEYVIPAPPYNVRDCCYIRLSGVFSVAYEYPIMRLGKLTEQSCRRLKEMWIIFVRRGQQSLSVQAKWAEEQFKKIAVSNEFQTVRRIGLALKEQREREIEREKIAAEKASRRLSHRH